MRENEEQSGLLDASCRVALAGLLHDLGKFSERARLEQDKDRLAAHETQYCPYRREGRKGWHTHKHAAHTALTWERIEAYLPRAEQGSAAPFRDSEGTGADDSLVNAASAHHRPETFLQWIIATADRAASGFERDAFEAYNLEQGGAGRRRSHYATRALTLFEQIDPERKRKQDLRWRYALAPQTVHTLFPQTVDDCQPTSNKEAQNEYRALWDRFLEALEAIPTAHRSNWPLWLDHFDSAWLAYTHAIPAATAGNTRPDVSLYDHSKAVAALATALWRYHHDRGDDTESIRQRLADSRRPDWGEKKLCLIQGDFFGVQDFLFSAGGETQKRAAHLLRGRSFYVSLLSECAALRILEALDLPSTSQIINAAGKFLIVAPNTAATAEAIANVQREMDAWFLTHSHGQAGIGLASIGACCNDFVARGDSADAKTDFESLQQKLFESLEEAKGKRFGLCAAQQVPEPVFRGYLDAIDAEQGVCAVDGKSPVATHIPIGDTRISVSDLAADHIEIGRRLVASERICIGAELDCWDQTLRVPIFGYQVGLQAGQADEGERVHTTAPERLSRLWHYGVPASPDEPLFRGLAWRPLNGYVPAADPGGARGDPRFADLRAEEIPKDGPRTFDLIARDDLAIDTDRPEPPRGTAALTTIKGDIDDLGRIIKEGLRPQTFARMAGLSRQINAYFSVWLPWYCRKHYPATYTVFAGGDDFFLIGPWRSNMRLASAMRQEFTRYVADNREIHFSAGLSMTKTGMPIRQMEARAEQALEQAKGHQEDGIVAKDAVTVFGYTVPWSDYEALVDVADELADLHKDCDLAIGYLYGLQYLADMADDVNRARAQGKSPTRLDSALWRSRFQYRTRRMLDRKGLKGEQARRVQNRIAEQIGERIEQYGAAFKIALFMYLYQQRR